MKHAIVLEGLMTRVCKSQMIEYGIHYLIYGGYSKNLSFSQFLSVK